MLSENNIQAFSALYDSVRDASELDRRTDHFNRSGLSPDQQLCPLSGA